MEDSIVIAVGRSWLVAGDIAGLAVEVHSIAAL